MFRLIIIWLLSINLAFAQNEQVGDLNTNTQNSTVNSNNPSTSETINYNGQGSSSQIPVNTAVSPSYMSNGSDTCLIGASGGVQVNVLGISGGFYRQDPECNRRRDAKALKDLGMNIAAIAIMCEEKEVWLSMFKSGTPCPISINGKLIVGKAAYYTMKKNPEVFIPNYKENEDYYKLTLQLEKLDEENSDSNLSISERFRTKLRNRN